MYCPILRFTDLRGRTRESKPSVADGRPLRVGKKMMSYYDPDDVFLSVVLGNSLIAMYIA